MLPKNCLVTGLLTLIGASAWGADAPIVRAPPDRVARVIAAHKMPSDGFSAFVQEVGQNTPLLEINPDMARNPASTIKLLTTFLALETLGPAYTWKTEAYLAGPVSNGFLEGDLYLKGYGDPYMVLERYWLFLRKLRQQGLRHITGDIVIDNSYFELPAAHAGEFDGQAFRSYNVIPDAMMVNFQTVKFIFEPDPATNRVRVIAEPEPTNLDIRNRLALTSGCGGFQRGIGVSISAAPAYDRVNLDGKFGRNCEPYSISRSVLPGADVRLRRLQEPLGGIRRHGAGWCARWPGSGRIGARRYGGIAAAV